MVNASAMPDSPVRLRYSRDDGFAADKQELPRSPAELSEQQVMQGL
jgi:hypothetical protein